jgi:hypothetical protein
MSLSEPIKKVKHILNDIAGVLSGSDRRRAAAKIAQEYGKGGQTFVAEELGMSRNTVRKGNREINGEDVEDEYYLRGRNRATDNLPGLESHIAAILDGQCQADPKFQTDRLYTNLSAKEVWRQLIKQYGYTEKVLPTVRTLNTIINELGYTLKTVKKTKPAKRVEETDQIFENLKEVHENAAKDDNIIRLSMDAKDKVKIGEFSRGGESRVEVDANDHDFGDKYATPFGIMDVKQQTTSIYLSMGKVTADFIVDTLEGYWESHGYSNSTGKILLLNVDNGPECNSSRTQFIKRLVEFSIDNNTEVILAYYPPYHSKYNPVEHFWGVLERHWGGGLLDSVEAIEKYVRTTVYAGKHPEVKTVGAEYKSGVKLSAKVMQIYEKALDRAKGLEKWFVHIYPQQCMDALAFTDCFY